MSKVKQRLDEMNINEVKELYHPLFKNLIKEEELNDVYTRYLKKYNKMIEAEKNGYKAPSGMGRGYKYLKNILYGWYFEELFFVLLSKNKNVMKIEFTGNDSEHIFIYDSENKKIKIEGSKTTYPDFLITLKNQEKIYIELKTAAMEVFSVKIGNVNKLQENVGFTLTYSVIIMIDLLNGLYGIQDMEDFLNFIPFINNRMEGQLCYEFPKPNKKFKEILLEDFSNYIKPKIFETEEIKSYRCLYIAQKNNDKKLARKIKKKIKLEQMKFEFKSKEEIYKEEVEEIIDEILDIKDKSWEELLLEIENKK